MLDKNPQQAIVCDPMTPNCREYIFCEENSLDIAHLHWYMYS